MKTFKIRFKIISYINALIASCGNNSKKGKLAMKNPAEIVVKGTMEAELNCTTLCSGSCRR